jgi:hypothetical protein
MQWLHFNTNNYNKIKYYEFVSSSLQLTLERDTYRRYNTLLKYYITSRQTNDDFPRLS